MRKLFRKFGQIHWKICKHYNAPHKKNWYKHKPQSVLETDNATILWDFAMHTDRKLIVVDITIKIKNYKINSCLLIKLMFLMDKKQSGG